MENEGHCSGELLDFCEGVEGKSCPIFRIFAVNVTDTCGKHCYAEVGNHLALVGVGNFAVTNNAVFFTADCANLSFERKTELVTVFNEFLCLCNIFFDRVVRAVEHYRREAGFDACLCSFV